MLATFGSVSFLIAMVEDALFTQLVLHLPSSDAPRPDAPPGYYWLTSYEDELKLFCRPIPLHFPFELDSTPLPLPAVGTLWIPGYDHRGFHFVLKRFEDCDRGERCYRDRPYNYTALPRHLRASLHLVTSNFPPLLQSWYEEPSDSSSDPDAPIELVLRPDGVNLSLSDFTVVDEQDYNLGLTLGGPRHISSEEYASVCALHRPRHSRCVFFREFRALSENLLRASRSSPLIRPEALPQLSRPAFGRAYVHFEIDPNFLHVGLAITAANDRWLSETDVRMCLCTYLGMADATAHSIWLRCRQIYVHDDVLHRGQQFIRARMSLVSAPLHVDVHLSYLEWVQNCPRPDAQSEQDSPLTPRHSVLSIES